MSWQCKICDDVFADDKIDGLKSGGIHTTVDRNTVLNKGIPYCPRETCLESILVQVPTIKHEGKKYLRQIYAASSAPPIGVDFLFVDVYEVLEAFEVTNQPIGHAIKKLLACGQRGKGSRLDDLIGAQAAISRAIDIEKRKTT